MTRVGEREMRMRERGGRGERFRKERRRKEGEEVILIGSGSGLRYWDR